MKVIELDLSDYSAVKPDNPVHLLFIHQAAGAQLMASQGDVKGEAGILKSHPNGGGLRALLNKSNYVVHEAAEGSKIGQGTDVCHWSRKFRDQMDRILRIKFQDMLHNDGTRNRVVMFQSGPSSNWIEADGIEPGKADSSDKTLANYKAAYRSLLSSFQQAPGTLFVALTAPPLVKPEPVKGIMSLLLGKQGLNPADDVGKRARSFNNWLRNIQTGWLQNYPLENVVVFDCYDVLTCYGASNWLRYPSGRGQDSMPSAEGNTRAALDFIAFINRARNRMAQHSISGIRTTPSPGKAAG